MNIQELLNSKGIEHSVKATGFLARCINPEHEDRNPSMSISNSGAFHCFSCGFSGNIYKHFGILSSSRTNLAISRLSDLLRKTKLSTIPLEIPDGAVPWTKEYRGISAKTMQEFEAFTLSNPKYKELADRIVFPIRELTGSITAFVGRALRANDKRYLIYPDGVALPVFPQQIKGSKIVLVEGPIDMLYLRDNGIHNVATTFGTQTIAERVDSVMFPFRTQGIEEVHILYDGDQAGRLAAKKLKPALEQAGFSAKIIDLPDDKDPADLTPTELSVLKGILKCE